MNAQMCGAIAEALLQCTPLTSLGEREALIANLPRATSIPVDPVPAKNALAIVEHCAYTPHAFDRLIDTLSIYPHLTEFCEVLSRYQLRPISFTDLFDLKQRLRQARVHEARVLQLATRLLGDFVEVPEEDPPLVWTIEELATRPVLAKGQALLQFLSLLRPDLPGEIREAVDAWLDRVAAANGFRLDLSEAVSEEEDHVPYLMIIVKARPGTQSYLLSAYLVRATARSLGSWEVPEFAECRQHVDEICSAALRHFRADPDMADRMVIQVFLPDELLACDVDRWMSRLSGRRSRPLGVELPVAVRSASRVYDAARYGGKVRVRWMRKWKERTRPPSRLLPKDVYTARCPEDLADLFERLEQEYLAFAAPIHVSYESAPQAFTDIIDSGVPVAIWPRHQRTGDLEADERLIHEVLCSAKLREVPASVYQSRVRAFKQKQDDSIFCDLVLLWDDPETIPADSPLALSERD